MLTEKQIRQVEHYLCAVCQHDKCGTHLCRRDHITYDEMEEIYNEKLADIDGQLEFPFKKKGIELTFKQN